MGLREGQLRILFGSDNFETLSRHPEDCPVGSSYDRMELRGKLERGT